MSRSLIYVNRRDRFGRRIRAGALGFAAALTLVACAGGAPEPTQNNTTQTQGAIAMALSGQASSGITYRLRNAFISADSSVTTLYLNSEDRPNSTTLSTNAAPGSYSVLLHDGWRLEEVGGTTVDAVLTSQNPQNIQVYQGSRTQMELRFSVSGQGDIGIGTSGIDIGIGVDD